MKKSKYYRNRLIIFSVLLLGVIFVFGYLIIAFYIPWRNQEGFYFRYDEMILSSNDKYLGVIDTEKEKVIILDSFGKEISSVDIKEKYPHQIALGYSSYFLLYNWENDNGAGKIVQYDYQSNKLKECMVSNIATISCKNKYLFIGDWKHREEEMYYYFTPYSNGFYANRYIREEQFGNQLKKLSADKEGCCIVDGIKMYYHESGYFSTEPVWEDYPGTSIGDFFAQDRSLNYLTETKQEMKNRDLLVRAIGNIEGVQEPTYWVCEYQSGNEVYGVCNVLEEYIPFHPVESSDVIKSYCYKITRGSNEIKIMAQKDSGIAVIATDFVYIYQKDNHFIRRNLKTGNEEVIYESQKQHSINVYVHGDYILVCDKDNRIPIKWNVE